jgi:hypothetical protein
MRPRRTKDEHGLRARNRHIECAHIRLPVLERDVAAVHAARERGARRFERALRGGVVAVAELELHHVANGGRHRIGREGILGAANDDGDELVLAGDWES